MQSSPHATAVLVPDVVSPGSGAHGAPFRFVAEAWLAQYTGATAKEYRRILAELEQWCRNAGIDPMAADRSVLQLYVRTYADRQLSLSTQAHYIIVLQSFYRFATDEEFLPRNPAARLRRPKWDDEQVHRPCMTRPQAARFLAQAEKMPPKWRDRDHALACLFVLNGLRNAEVCGLNIETMSSQRGHQTIIVRGKGGTIATVALAPVTYWSILKYIGDRETGPVFLGAQGARLDPAVARRRIQSIARAAGLPPNIGPHACRRTAITGALDAGIPLRDVQAMARHKDPRTTSVYDRRRESLDRSPTYTLGNWFSGG